MGHQLADRDQLFAVLFEFRPVIADRRAEQILPCSTSCMMAVVVAITLVIEAMSKIVSTSIGRRSGTRERSRQALRYTTWPSWPTMTTAPGNFLAERFHDRGNPLCRCSLKSGERALLPRESTARTNHGFRIAIHFSRIALKLEDSTSGKMPLGFRSVEAVSSAAQSVTYSADPSPEPFAIYSRA